MKACVEMDREGLSTMTDTKQQMETSESINLRAAHTAVDAARFVVRQAVKVLESTCGAGLALQVYEAILPLDKAKRALDNAAAELPKREGGTR